MYNIPIYIYIYIYIAGINYIQQVSVLQLLAEETSSTKPMGASAGEQGFWVLGFWGFRVSSFRVLGLRI